MMNSHDGNLTGTGFMDGLASMNGGNTSTTFEQGFVNQNNTMYNDPNQPTFASTFRNRSAALTTEELRKARESRAAEALKMKDEQLRILSEQNAQLLKQLDRLEEEANTIQLEKVAIEQENRNVRDTNFELQSKARAAETISKRLQIDIADKEKQLRIMTDQNSELLRLLESEESLTAKLQGEVNELRAELDELRQKYNALLTTAKTHEELATKAAKEGQLRAEEIRLLRVEVEQLKQQNTELKMKTQIEVEALQEQLRVRKEKQYQLLEKLQAQEEAKRQAEDQVAGMEEQLRGLHARNVDLETQNKVESRSKSNIEEANKELQIENTSLFNQNKELQAKIERSEKERLRMEAEARDSGDQLREMSEKVFQLLERLKLAELGKTKAMEALKKKEQDMVSLQKKNARLIKESTEESKAKVKAEMDNKVLQEQVRALKKNNTSLAQKSKEEALQKVKVMEERDQLDEKLKTMESRLSFLLNKVQADEENRIVQAEDRKKLEAQVISYTEKCEELQHKLTEMGESNRVITQAMRLKQEEINEVSLKYEHVVRELQARENEFIKANTDQIPHEETRPGAPDDIENVRLNEGRGRFYVEAKSIGGGSLLILKARKPGYKEWLERQGVNDFLKKAQKTTRFRDVIVEKFAAVFGLLMVEEEEKLQLLEQVTSREQHIEMQQKKLALVQDTLAIEEDAKRRMLLRYIHAVKEHAMSLNEGSGGVLQLPESNLGDEEIHALAALLRNNMSIDEVNLRSNQITDDGARALAAVLAGKSGLKLIDLRGNKISKAGIKSIAEALERCERVKHVYVHAGGKVEALGTSRWANPRGEQTESVKNTTLQSKTLGTVETVCVVDIRDNTPESVTFPYALESVSSSNGDFKPTLLLETTGVPSSQVMNNDSPNKSDKKKKHNKIIPKSVSKSSMMSSADSGFGVNAEQKAKDKIKAHEDQLRALKELAWQGRSGGMDVPNTIDVSQSVDYNTASAIRDALKKKKVNSRTPLPPLDGNNNTADFPTQSSPPRGHSAPDKIQATRMLESFGIDPDNPEGMISTSAKLNLTMKENDDSPKQKAGKKKKKVSETEKRLMNSPFAQPVFPKQTNPVNQSGTSQLTN